VGRFPVLLPRKRVSKMAKGVRSYVPLKYKRGATIGCFSFLGCGGLKFLEFPCCEEKVPKILGGHKGPRIPQNCGAKNATFSGDKRALRVPPILPCGNQVCFKQLGETLKPCLIMPVVLRSLPCVTKRFKTSKSLPRNTPIKGAL